MTMLLRKYLSGPLCVLFIAGLTLAGGGKVLCLGDDGHVKVESPCQPCCETADESAVLEQAGCASNCHTECVNCTDLPLDHSSVSLRPVIKRFNVSSLSMDLVVVAPGDITIRRAHCAPAEPGETPPTLSPAQRSLSTTVLRC